MPPGLLWVVAFLAVSDRAIGSPGTNVYPGESEPRHSLPLYFPSAQNDGVSTAKIRTLSQDFRSRATSVLLDLTQKRTVVENAKTRLEIVRALSAHEQHISRNDPVRTRIVRALMVFFEVEVESSRGIKIELDGAVRHLARGTAAMALARAEHPEALRKLVAVALSGDHSDPVGASLARTALSTVSERALGAQNLAPLFSAKDVKKALRPATLETAHPHLPPLSPEALAALGKKWLEADLRIEPGPLDFEQAIHALLQAETLPSAYRDAKSWQAAHEKDPTWTMRSAALLNHRLPRSAINKTIKLARSSLSSQNKVELSAAAWLLSVAEPLTARTLLKGAGTEVTFAVLRQASDGVVANIVADTLPQLPDTKHVNKEERFGQVARRMILLEPSTWGRFSTSELRKGQASQDGSEWLAPLASRTQHNEKGLAPNSATLELWLRSDNHKVRSAAALGLGESPSTHVGALLFSAYRDETDPVVRRALVSSLRRKGLVALPLVRDVLALDPDEGCRALFAGTSDPGAVGAYLAVSHQQLVKIDDRQGRVLHLVPDGDGFVGIVRPTL